MSAPTTTTTDLAHLREREYRLRLDVNRLRRELYEGADPANPPPELLDRLRAAEAELDAAAKARAAAQAQDPTTGVIADNRSDQGLLGPETTGLEVTLTLGMDYVPTAIVHLLTADAIPLVTCAVRNAQNTTRRLRITSFIDGYSAAAVDTVELEAQQTHVFRQLPVMYPAAAREVSELTRATLNVLVEDLDRGTSPVELHRSVPVWLLARTSAPLALQDPASGEWHDTSPFFGAFVTPNATAVMAFLRKAADHHPQHLIVGYQGDESMVEPQVQAVFDALKQDGRLTYVNSVLTSSPDEGFPDQRVRLPRESLEEQQANCIDGTVLYASLLEAASLSPAIVVVPGHAFLAWETWDGSNDWRYLETTMTGSHSFADACAAATQTAQHYAAQGTGIEGLRLWPVRRLRSEMRITPME
jgi:hypothetical protein